MSSLGLLPSLFVCIRSGILRASMLVALLAGFAPLTMPALPAHAANVGDVTTFLAPPTGAYAITAGSDGNLWFIGANTITRASTSGSVTSFPLPAGKNIAPYAIVAGPDGNIWFSDQTPSTSSALPVFSIARITPSGVITEFTLPSPRYLASSITPGPDGNIWFSEFFVGTQPSDLVGIPNQPDRVARVTPSGIITEFPLSLTDSVGHITAGPDGNLWLTMPGRIARITPNGNITRFALSNDPAVTVFPGAITAGADGNLWFEADVQTGSQIPRHIGRMTLNGAVTIFPGNLANVEDITAGPDGNVWFTEDFPVSKIGRITPSGVLDEFSPVFGPGAFNPFRITAGPDGNMWFTVGYRFGYIVTGASAPVPTTRRAVLYIGGIDSQSGCDMPNSGQRLSDEGPGWLQPTLAALPNVDPNPYYFSYAGPQQVSQWRDCTTNATTDGAVGGIRDMAVYGVNPVTRISDTCSSLTDEAAQLTDQITRITQREPNAKVVLVAHSQGGLLAATLVGTNPSFARANIAAVVTFDSFPHGMPDAFALDAEVVYPDCAGQPNLAFWPEGPNNDGALAQGVVPFYTLAATSVWDPLAPVKTFSIGGLDDTLTGFGDTDAKHVRIGGASHISIWDNSPNAPADWAGIYGALSPMTLLVAQPARQQAQQMVTCAVQGVERDACVISPTPFGVTSIGQVGQVGIDINALPNRLVGVLNFAVGVLQQSSVIITQETNALSQPAGRLISSGVSFTLQLVSETTGDVIGTLSNPLAAPYQMVLNYDPALLQSLGVTRPQDQLGIYFLDTDSNQWLKVDSTVVDPIARTITGTLTHATEFAVLADVVPPVTTATVTGTQATGGTSVFVGSANVVLSATDDQPGSGIGATYYQALAHGSVAPSTDLPGNWKAYSTPFDVSAGSTAGDLDVYAFSEDRALNAEVPQLVAVIGQAPTVSISGAPNQEVLPATSVTLVTSVSGGAAPYSYSWIKNGVAFVGNAPSIADAPTDTATYAVTVTDNVGLRSNTAQVTISVTSSVGGGGCTGVCPPPTNATPELDSLTLLGSGLLGLASYGALHWRGRRQRLRGLLRQAAQRRDRATN